MDENNSMTDFISLQDFFYLLDNNVTVVTPNRRLSASLQKQFANFQFEHEKKIWETKEILPLHTWLLTLWQQLQRETFEENRHLLTLLQEQYLWEQLIGKSKSKKPLLHISETAQLTLKAFHLLRQWALDFNILPDFDVSAEYQLIKNWLQTFEETCRKKNWISIAALPSILHEKSKDLKNILQRKIYLVGFTDITPQMKILFDTLKSLGVSITEITIRKQPTSIHRLQLKDEETEFYTMARWAKSILDQYQSKSIGCIVPDLEKKRDRILQIFNEVFNAEKHEISNVNLNILNISAGMAISNYPAIKIALLILKLPCKSISLDQFTQLILSPFIGGSLTEEMKRNSLDQKLREYNQHQIELKKIIEYKYICPILFFNFKKFIQHYETRPSNTRFSEWAIFFQELWQRLGWPGERSLNSEEFQIVEFWLSLLSEYTTLDFINDNISYETAIQVLERLAKRSIFQPKTPDASIQILGLLEAASLSFDYIWVSNLNDVNWPPAPKPHPFMPKKIQREHKMPHATAERELKFCQSLTEQFIHSATHVLFSHHVIEDELQFDVSPLIRDIPEINISKLNLKPHYSYVDKLFEKRDIEIIIDHIAPSITPNEKSYGGVTILKNQALCPFRAFAEIRLKARELETVTPGLRAKDRGSIIHKILELIWNKLNSQEMLLSLDDIELNELITTCINHALMVVPHFKTEFKNYLALERKRLQKIIFDWLSYEKERAPFKILFTERQTNFNFNHLNLSLRIDRVDELENGQKIIIDYKTSKNVDMNHWFGERLEEPQLPLYCLQSSDQSVGIAFAQIVAGHYSFKGLSKINLDIKGVKMLSEMKKSEHHSWELQLLDWRNAVNKLSQDFHQGIADVDPKDKKETCVWCSLNSFCRIQEEINTNE